MLRGLISLYINYNYGTEKIRKIFMIEEYTLTLASTTEFYTVNEFSESVKYDLQTELRIILLVY